MNLNDTPFEHICVNGTKVRADRCDFVGGIDVNIPKGLTQEQVMQDMLALGSWHWANIVPSLNGYTGPPRIRITPQE